MFAAKNGGQLRARLAQVGRDARLGKLTGEEADAQRTEILAALRSLGDQVRLTFALISLPLIPFS